MVSLFIIVNFFSNKIVSFNISFINYYEKQKKKKEVK